MGLFSGITKSIGGVFNAASGAAAPIGGAAGMPWLGPALGFAGSMLGQQSANQANSAQSARQMAFQERMSNTAHQRQVVDLKAAGLNPILSANSGASSPGGAQANIQSALGSGVSSAREVARTAAEISNLKQINKQIQATTRKTNTEELLLKQQLPKAKTFENLWSEGLNIVEGLRHKTGLVGSAVDLGRQIGSQVLSSPQRLENIGKMRQEATHSAKEAKATGIKLKNTVTRYWNSAKKAWSWANTPIWKRK